MNTNSFADEIAREFGSPVPEQTGDGFDDPDAPGDGRASTHQQFAVSFYMPDGTVEGALYAHLKGAPWRNKWKDATVVKIWFMGVVGGREGDWCLTVTGEKLDRLHDELRDGRRISIRPTKTPADGRRVAGIVIKAMPIE